MPGSIPESHPIVLFDGLCNLCNRLVRFLIQRDPEGNLRYASLQSKFGQQQLRRFDFPADQLDTFVLVINDQAVVWSDAALQVLSYLQFPWPLLNIFRVVPSVIRDYIYQWVARNRIKWFGRTEVCPLPTPEQKSRFYS